MVAARYTLHWQLEPAASGMPGQGSSKRERQAEVTQNLVAAGITQVRGARKRSLVDVEQSAAISGADAAGMSLPKLDEVTVWLPNQADPVCVECDGQGVRAWFKGKTPKPCLPWLLAVRTGRASKSCPFMGKVGHANGNSQCHKSGPDWLTARLRFVPKRFHAALLWTGVQPGCLFDSAPGAVFGCWPRLGRAHGSGLARVSSRVLSRFEGRVSGLVAHVLCQRAYTGRPLQVCCTY